MTSFAYLIFGTISVIAVCLALYIAFWLQLDNAYWAGTSAAIVCQPSLGTSLRKGWFRVIGTVVGAPGLGGEGGIDDAQALMHAANGIGQLDSGAVL